MTRACVLAPAGRGEPYRYVPYEGCIKRVCNLTQRNKTNAVHKKYTPTGAAASRGVSLARATVRAARASTLQIDKVQGEVRCGQDTCGPRSKALLRPYSLSHAAGSYTLARAPHSTEDRIEPPRLSGSACCYLGPYTQSPRQKSTGARRCRPLRRTPPG